jgi:hypothetical protein
MTPTHPGTYSYTDQPGHTETIEVVSDAGELCAKFKDEDGWELIPIRDMAGEWSE